VSELAGLELPISSSEIRARLAAGDRNVPLPPPVFEWIREHRLYRSQSQ
jgi:nicotinic acid mononucleotide adenylyltransferase